MPPTRILTPLQETFLSRIFLDPWFRENFYLTGGTALSAFYLYHRYSEDLDFFSHGTELDSIPKLIQDVSKELNKKVIEVQKSPGFLRFLVGDELKIDVVADVGFRVGTPIFIDQIRVDTLKNIAVNKVCAILGRLDIKDYVDLYIIFSQGEFDIFELLKQGKEKDQGLDPFVWASLVAEVDKFNTLPRLIKPVTLDQVSVFFLRLRDQILDSLNPISS
ncbi:MAG: nucleotidyl transferase AbiEii/AbiGii toxin family protein [Chlamydiae bacterium]|nr:nucleotidyl transferase AbiEii/AbiGii toxin family protein [Chlamydiota bacterium]MBI3276933.1 nucleotidyl transferase AbiEii/AbiGii toxin family protein [Chlamydiota bacterium]